MSNHEVIYRKTITSAQGCRWTNLDPRDFKYCDSIEMLKEEIECYFEENLYAECDVHVYESTTEIEIPEEFIKEWEELKSNLK